MYEQTYFKINPVSQYSMKINPTPLKIQECKCIYLVYYIRNNW